MIGDAFGSVLARAKDGDSDAFADIYRDLHPMMLRFLRSRIGDIGEDIATEVWMSAASSLRQFDGTESDFRSWMFTLARRRVVDHLRSNERRVPTTTLDSAPEATHRSAEDTVTEDMGGQAAVDWLVRVLTPDQAEVVLLRVLGGLSAEDVADVMGRPTTWVRVTQHRAVRRLAERGMSQIVVTP